MHDDVINKNDVIMHSWNEHPFLSGKEHHRKHLVHQPSHIETGQLDLLFCISHLLNLHVEGWSLFICSKAVKGNGTQLE